MHERLVFLNSLCVPVLWSRIWKLSRSPTASPAH